MRPIFTASGLITKIILTRPNVPCGRSLGFFPGTIESKFAPWTVPVTDAMRDRLGKAVFDLAVKNGDIEVVPFEVMRGRSWRDAFVLLDEAQNTTETEIKMFLTRTGEGCVTVINGDIAQCDLAEWLWPSPRHPSREGTQPAGSGGRVFDRRRRAFGALCDVGPGLR